MTEKTGENMWDHVEKTIREGGNLTRKSWHYINSSFLFFNYWYYIQTFNDDNNVR